MIHLIVGEKGEGKTKILLDRANTRIKEATGNIVYIDKNKQHMYKLNNRVRLIDITSFPVRSSDAFIGFLCGILSQDNDLEEIYLDSFLKIADANEENLGSLLDLIDKISDRFTTDFYISISISKDKLPEKFQASVITE